jgi:pimeloyl-ACP methyl ester carboxylesterase
VIPVSHAHAAVEAMPGSRLAIMEGCGHFPHAEDPSQFASVLLEFFDSTDPSALGPDDLSNRLREAGAH